MMRFAHCTAAITMLLVRGLSRDGTGVLVCLEGILDRAQT
jgi:hypothetical protein